MQAVTMSHLVEEYEDDDTEQIPGNDQGGLEQFPEWMLETPEGRRARTFEKSSLTLSFVRETGTERPRGAYRSMIRSQARTKRPVGRKYGASGDKPGQEGTYPSSRPKNILPRNQRSRFLALRPGPETGGLDPFSALPVAKHGHPEELLNYYDKVYRQTYNPVSPREKWIPFAMSDPALMHATLFCAGLSRCLLRSKSFDQDIFYHRGMTIKLMSERLEDPEFRPTDASISAIACLLAFEIMSGNAEGSKIHMSGLESLVRKKGGLDALGTYGLPRKLLSWLDCGTAIICEAPPRFPISLHDHEFDDLAYRETFSSLLQRYQSRLVNLTGSKQLSQETISACWHLQSVSSLKELMSYQLPAAKREFPNYNDSLERLERRAQKLIAAECSNDSGLDYSIYAVFGYAIAIHIYYFLRDVPRGAPLFHLMSSRIRERLEKVNLVMLQLQYPEMVLWILMMAGIGGIGSPNRRYFALLLADMCSDLGIRGGIEIAANMEEFFWSDIYRSPATISFWRDVASAQGMKEGYEVVRQLKDDLSVAHFLAPLETEQFD